MSKALASNLQRPCDVLQVEVVICFEAIGEISGGLVQRARSFRRQNQQHVFPHSDRRDSRRRLLYHDMRIRSADTERTDAGAARRLPARPGTAFSARDERASLQLETWI